MTSQATARFDVYVVPNSPRPGPDGRHGGKPRLRVSAAPEDGKANAEVERMLGKVLGAKVHVVAGHRSRMKVCETSAEALEGLGRVFAD